MTSTIIVAVLCAVVGFALGYVLNRYVINAKSARAADEAERLLKTAEKQAENLKKEALLEVLFKEVAHWLTSRYIIGVIPRVAS